MEDQKIQSNKQPHKSLFEFKKTILVVDDEEINRSILSMMLEQDFNIIESCDGKDALDILLSGEKRIDLVLLDVFMPNDAYFSKSNTRAVNTFFISVLNVIISFFVMNK